MLDLANNILTKKLGAATITATGNDSVIVDVQGYQGDVVFHVDWIGATFNDPADYLKLTVMEGDDPTLSDAVEVTDASRYSKLATIEDAAAGVVRLGFIIGLKRYIRLRFNESGTVSVPLRAIAILGAPRHAPVP